MTIRNGIFTSEAVAAGHPDKICDQISDAILDACLKEDRHSRVAVETAIKGHTACLLGEVSTSTKPDYKAIVRSVLGDIGHGDGRWELDIAKLDFVIRIFKQSGEISHGVDRSELGAGDQGIMFGYATNETPNLMPAPIDFANRLIRRHSHLRKDGWENELGPDAKSQVSVAYDNGVPAHIAAIVLSTQHAKSIELKELRQLVREKIIEPELEALIRPDTVFHINPAGTFHSGGPIADAGLTGRKIIADTYGGYARHGGGAFSGKDASKVDRSAAYAARQIARHAVSKGWVDRCEIQISYAIGYEKPVSVDFVGDSENDADFLQSKFENAGIDLNEILHPAAIINRLNLTDPIFQDTASGGHFGRSEFAWEQEIQI